MVDRGAYIHWLTSEIHSITIYHNHKENMAWLATVLYIGGAPTSALYTSPSAPLQRWVLVVLVLILTVMIGLFVRTQFRNRAIASDIINALMITLNNFCADSTFSPDKTGNAASNWQKWPQFVQDEIDQQKGRGRPFSDRLGTDYVSYTAIIGAMLITLAIVLRT